MQIIRNLNDIQHLKASGLITEALAKHWTRKILALRLALEPETGVEDFSLTTCGSFGVLEKGDNCLSAIGLPDSLAEIMPVDATAFRQQLQHFVLFRTLQVLGAYGFRGYFEKKPHFLQSIPFALENLRAILPHLPNEYPYLLKVLNEMTELKQFREVTVRKPLVVKMYSFSYKKGIPNDDSGNGGGYVFDCRAVNNPGKYERYASLTGLDESVRTFLEEDGEIISFLDHATHLVDASVKRYIDRGFTNLMVSFGCTGGQHRSVYSAQYMAKYINEKFGVEVNLIHREQNKEQHFAARKQ